MSNIAEIYTHTIRENFHPLFANWEPGTPIELGAYGPMDGDSFIHVGNIKDLGLNFDIRKDLTKDNKLFSSKGSAIFKLGAKGSININGMVNTKATLQIAFTSEDAVFFNAAECDFQMMRDKAKIGKVIMQRYRDHEWERAWAIVTDVVVAGATTIAISGGKTSSIVFEASGNVDRIDLADASLNLNITSQESVGYVVEAKKGLVPLIGMSKIQSTFLWVGEKYKPISLVLNHSRFSIMRNSPDIQTEESSDDIYFGQMNF